MVERRSPRPAPPAHPDAAAAAGGGERAFATRWVNMARACEVLGVNESTVRRWADAGQIGCFRTPGGHRRFSERELLELVEGRSGGRRRELEEAALRRIRRDLSSGHRDVDWYEQLAADERETLRPLGRRLVELVDDDIARRRPHTEIEREVDAIGERYGHVLFERGMPLSQAIEAFTFFRRSLDEAAKRLAERRRMDASEAARAREHIAGLADRVLRGVSASYDDPSVTPRHHAAGGAASQARGVERGPAPPASIFIELRGRRVLLVGESRETPEQVAMLAGGGADVTILAPAIGDALRRLVREGRALWTSRAFAPGDTAGFDVVMVANDGGSGEEGAAAEARARGIRVGTGGFASGGPGAGEERGE